MRGLSESSAPAPYQGPRAVPGPLPGSGLSDPGFSDSAPPRVLDSESGELGPGKHDSAPGSPGTRKPSTDKSSEPGRRSSGLFGRMFPPAVTTRKRSDNHDAVTVEPRTDPAADAAVKRRIERLIGDSQGERLRSYEVRVVGKEVVIRAKATRFWQKRTVRNALDSLPGLNGYKVTVEMVD